MASQDEIRLTINGETSSAKLRAATVAIHTLTPNELQAKSDEFRKLPRSKPSPGSLVKLVGLKERLRVVENPQDASHIVLAVPRHLTLNNPDPEHLRGPWFNPSVHCWEALAYEMDGEVKESRLRVPFASPVVVSITEASEAGSPSPRSASSSPRSSTPRQLTDDTVLDDDAMRQLRCWEFDKLLQARSREPEDFLELTNKLQQSAFSVYELVMKYSFSWAESLKTGDRISMRGVKNPYVPYVVLDVKDHWATIQAMGTATTGEKEPPRTISFTGPDLRHHMYIPALSPIPHFRLDDATNYLAKGCEDRLKDMYGGTRDTCRWTCGERGHQHLAGSYNVQLGVGGDPYKNNRVVLFLNNARWSTYHAQVADFDAGSLLISEISRTGNPNQLGYVCRSSSRILSPEDAENRGLLARRHLAACQEEQVLAEQLSRQPNDAKAKKLDAPAAKTLSLVVCGILFALSEITFAGLFMLYAVMQNSGVPDAECPRRHTDWLLANFVLLCLSFLLLVMYLIWLARESLNIKESTSVVLAVLLRGIITLIGTIALLALLSTIENYCNELTRAAAWWGAGSGLATLGLSMVWLVLFDRRALAASCYVCFKCCEGN